MANSPQARKRARQSVVKGRHNAAMRSTFRTVLKKVRRAIVAGDVVLAKKLFKEAVPQVDRIAGKNVFHPNAAARYKSRLASQIKKLDTSAA